MSMFFGRDWELKETLRLLRDNKSLLLLGARRIGKTFLSQKIISVLGNEKWNATLVDIGGCDSEDDVVRCIENQTNSWLGKVLNVANRTEIAAGEYSAKIHVGEESWLERGATRFRKLADEKHGALLVIDEAPVFLKRLLDRDTRRAERWLQALRTWRMQSPGLRLVLAGSIGINTLAKRYQLTTAINDLMPFELEAFDKQTAEEFLAQLAAHKQKTLANEARDHLLKIVGWPVPYYLDILFEESLQACRRDSLKDAHDIEKGVDRLFRTQGSFLQHWHDRLNDHGKKEADAMRQLLKKLAPHPAGLKREQLGSASNGTRDHYLDLLMDEGYLATAEGMQLVFRSELVRRWWIAQ